MPICEETGNIVTGTAWTGLLVNKDAERWDNEVTDTYDYYTMRQKRLLTYDPTGLHFSITDEGMRQDNPPEGKQPRMKIYDSDTIEGLAEKLGLDPKALKATVDEYNSDIEKYGYDRKFGRRRQNNHKDGPALKLEKPPYQGIRMKICLTSMKGGLKINAKDQVLDQFDNVIPGLYAAGEVAGGLEGIPHHYYTGRMTLQAFVQGRIAGDVAADEAGQ